MKTKSNLSFKTTAGRFILLRNLIATLCAIVFTACEQTMTLNEENGDAAALQIGANVAQLTKATDAGFELKDTLGLYAVKWQDASTPDTLRPTTNHADNVWFRLESNVENWKPEHIVYFPTDNNKIDLYAYYPHRTSAFANGTQINLNVATNQTDSVDYTRSDFMAAKTLGVKRTPNKVLLSFEHKLSQMTIELKPGTGFSFADLKNAEVKIVNAITDATYDLAAMNTTPTVEDPEHRTVPVAGSTRADITPYGTWYQKGDTTLAGKMAILVPQTLGANTYIQVTLGSRKFNFKSDNINLNSGCSRRFTLTLSNTGLDITTIIIPWKNCGAVAGEAEEEFEEEPIVIMTTAKQSINFSVGRTPAIEVDWGDGTREKKVFNHTYTDGLEHTIRFYGSSEALKSLDCHDNQLTNLYVNRCTALSNLNCWDNKLTVLEINGCTALANLSCDKNQLTTLNINECINLTHLSCTENKLTILNISKCTSLIYVDCYSNQLANLDISGCIALTDLYCAENRITNLDISRNTDLKILECSRNKLSILKTGKCKALKTLACYSNQLTNLDISECTNLTDLVCLENQLTDLDISKFSQLTNLDCRMNQIIALNINECPILKSLKCSENQLTMLDFSGHNALTELFCEKNQLNTLDISQCTALKQLICYDNKITNLNVSECPALIALNCRNNPLLTDNTQMMTFANSLTNWTGKEKGTLIISNPTAATQIKSITDAKNWGVE